MKKLSIEEKEKVYIFPELKESNDEKIKKAITEFFKNFSKNGTWKAIPDVTKWIAWLEKQGEQKPADKVEPKFKVGDTIKYNGTEYKITEITPNGYKVYALTYDEDAASLISFSAPAILVEQKPEWNEEDLKTIRQIIRIVKDSGCSNRCYERIAKFLHNITPNPKSEQEWSEEDEKLLELSVENLTELKDRFGNEYGRTGDCIEWLKKRCT